jgi:hypothetical protein
MLRASAMLVVTLGLAILPAAGQTPAAGPKANPEAQKKFEMGLTFTYKIAQVSDVPGSRYLLLGASTDGVYRFSGKKTKNWGLAYDAGAESASNTEPYTPQICQNIPSCVVGAPYNLNLHQVTIVAGPRYTWMLSDAATPHRVSMYGQVLVGAVHAFDGVFPHANGGASTISTTATSVAVQAGGGLNMRLTQNLGLRLLEADYVMTRLPNNANNYQGDIRFSNGITFHF